MGAAEAVTFFQSMPAEDFSKDREVVICPPFPLIGVLSGMPAYALGAQNCSSYEEGSFTGDVNASLLKEMDCSYVIVGHSERRQFFHETNADIKAKALQVLSHGMLPILCVGESLETYEQGQTQAFLQKQLEECLPETDFILAYEPLWAIGTGKIPSLDEIQSVHSFLKDVLAKNGIHNTPILYGGSVTGDNAQDILALEDVSGVLVGGASLKADEFSRIVRS